MFEQIKKKYPKAWEKFDDWCFNKGFNINQTGFIESLIGWLFTFFDEQGIVIWIGHAPSGFTSYVNNKLIDVFKSRPEAWQAAFTKAFEIYEQILEQK